MCCIAGSTYGSVLVQYDTAPSTSNATLSASVEDASVSAVDLSAGSGIVAANGGTYNWNGWADGGVANASFAEALSEDEFWTWGFDVTSAVTIESMTMDIRLDRSGTGPNQVEIQAAVNGGVASSVLTHDFGDSGSGVDFVGVDLSALGSLSQGDSVVFTLAAFGADSGGASQGGTFDLETVDFNGSDPRSLRIEGSISAVPEPGALAGIASLGLLAGVIRRRRCRA